MAVLIKPKTDVEIKNMAIANVRKAYSELANEYNRIVNDETRRYLYCHRCNS